MNIHWKILKRVTSCGAGEQLKENICIYSVNTDRLYKNLSFISQNKTTANYKPIYWFMSQSVYEWQLTKRKPKIFLKQFYGLMAPKFVAHNYIINQI